MGELPSVRWREVPATGPGLLLGKLTASSRWHSSTPIVGGPVRVVHADPPADDDDDADTPLVVEG